MHELLAYALSKMHRVVAEEELLPLGYWHGLGFRVTVCSCHHRGCQCFPYIFNLPLMQEAWALSSSGHALCSGLGPAQRPSSLQLKAPVLLLVA